MTSLGAPDEIAQLDATSQAALVAAGKVSPSELVDLAIGRIEALNPTLKAVIFDRFEQARAEAAQLTESIARDGVDPAQPFAGVPYLVKDLVAEIDGMPCTQGSKFVRGYTSSHDQEIVIRLKQAGLVIVGKTNTPEFGLAPHCEPDRFGATRNPWDLDISTAGSSGGSAAAVAAGLVPAAHGNDFGGSLRYPAAVCGLVGLKPTRARVPLGPEYGDPFSGLAIEHGLTRSVRDTAALLDAVAGPALGDPYPAPATAGPFAEEVGRPPSALRLAWADQAAQGRAVRSDCVAAVHEAVALCEAQGHQVEQCWLPEITPEVGQAIGTAFFAGSVWIVDHWTAKLGRHPEPGELEPVTEFFVEHGRSITAAAYLTALETLRTYSRKVAGFFETYDGWITPTVSQPAPRLGEMTGTDDDPLAGLSVSADFIGFAGLIANVTGNPAISLPLHWTADGLPLGVQVLGRFGDEATLLRLAAQLEAAKPWAGNYLRLG